MTEHGTNDQTIKNSTRKENVLTEKIERQTEHEN